MEGMTFYRFREGKVAEIWDVYDTLAVMRQLAPEPGAGPALSG